MKTPILSLNDVELARSRLAGSLRRTPCHVAPVISEIAGRRVWLKRDDLQRTGSFKERGARHALVCLNALEASRGVVAASAGNHALGLAFHGAAMGIKVTVVMPVNASPLKVARCRGLGAEVVLHGGRFDEAQRFAADLASRLGASQVHPFDDLRVIAGQGTMALEILEEVSDFDTLVLPVGGGGLLAGSIAAVKAVRPSVRVIAVEPANAAGFLAACLNGSTCAAALAPTLADGLAVARVGQNTFEIAAPLIDDVVTVSEDEIAAAMALLARREGIIAEGAGAVATAAILAGRINGRAVVAPICGRNVEARLHQRVIEDDAAFSHWLPHAA